MERDDATGELINICSVCGKEVVGYVNDPYEDYICEDCEVDEDGEMSKM